MERARLAKMFEQGLDTVIAHVLPVGRDASGATLAHRSVVPAARALLPGARRLAGGLSAAAGLAALGQGERLPVHPGSRSDGAGACAAARRDIRFQVVPGRAFSGFRARPRTLETAEDTRSRGTSAADITRTAMCAEPRNGTLYIFMPPTEELEEYLELVAAIEATAEALDTPVVLEGYEPPQGPAAQQLSRDAGSRRHRGEHPPVRQLGRTGGPHHAPVRGRARSPG